MNEANRYIFLFLVSTTVLNLVISIFARVKSRDHVFNTLIHYWIALFINFIAAAVLSDSSQEIALAYFFQFIPVFIISAFLMQSRGINFNPKLYGLIYLLGASLSLVFIFYTEFGFTLSLLPITISTTLPLFHPMWNILISNRSESNWIEKGMAFLFLTSIVNHFNYAFFRLVPEYAWWGWSVSVAQYQSLMVFLPLLVHYRSQKNERNNLKQALTKLTGDKSNIAYHVEELYKNLNTEISQKKKLNKHLEEEREMNELLIRTISHDMANPLSVIGAYTDLITNGRIPPSDVNLTLEKIKNNLESAKSMIKRIRDAILSRNHAGLVTIHKVSLDESLASALKLLEAKINEKNLIINFQNGFKAHVAAEENTLTHHVFSNFLSNAINFSPEGKTITIDILEETKTVHIIFKDQGLGIAKHRFEKSILESTEDTTGTVGSGIGLQVAGYFLRKFGGEYKISSEGSNQGTTVVVTLEKIL